MLSAPRVGSVGVFWSLNSANDFAGKGTPNTCVPYWSRESGAGAGTERGSVGGSLRVLSGRAPVSRLRLSRYLSRMRYAGGAVRRICGGNRAWRFRAALRNHDLRGEAHVESESAAPSSRSGGRALPAIPDRASRRRARPLSTHRISLQRSGHADLWAKSAACRRASVTWAAPNRRSQCVVLINLMAAWRQQAIATFLARSLS